MTPLIITQEVRDNLAALRQFAEQRPVNVIGINVRLKDPEAKRVHMVQMTEQTIEVPTAFLVTFSIEEGHPCGRALHMSMSVQIEGRVPHPVAVWTIAKELGFVGEIVDCVTWIETLKGHGRAVNIVQPIGQTERAAPSDTTKCACGALHNRPSCPSCGAYAP